MKKITIGYVYNYFPEGKTLSRSFKSKISEYMTAFLGTIIDSKHKDQFTKFLDIDFGNAFTNLKYDESIPNMMLYEVASKGAYVMAESMVYWESVNGYKEPIYPWTDVSEVEVNFKTSISDADIKRINRFLDETYTYICHSKESGLGYDYEIRGDLPEGNIVFSFKQKPTKEEIQLLEETLLKWRCEYEQNHENQIHYIGDFAFKNGKVYAYIDGLTGIDMIKECLDSFKNCGFIKRITFK